MRLIDADALYDAMRDEEFQTFVPLDEVDSVIYKAPTIEAEPVRHGKWIEKQQMIAWCDDDVDVYYTCSACEADSPCEYPFCPNCGAKMDLEG